MREGDLLARDKLLHDARHVLYIHKFIPSENPFQYTTVLRAWQSREKT